jgi:hypothetical protein
VASLIRDHYLTAMARGWGDIDWAALARVVEENASLPNAELLEQGH